MDSTESSPITLDGSSTCLGVLALIMLAACAPRPSQYTVDYYQAHPEERREKVSECANDPGALKDDPLCINAGRADVLEGIGSLRRLPPMGLVEAEEKAQRQRKKLAPH